MGGWLVPYEEEASGIALCNWTYVVIYNPSI